MNERAKIDELEKQIASLQEQLKTERTKFRINWNRYYEFNNSKYANGSHTLNYNIGDPLRRLALCLLSLYEGQTYKGDYTLSTHDLPNTRKLTTEQVEYVNNFLDDVYPVIEKYALISIEKNKSDKQ